MPVDSAPYPYHDASTVAVTATAESLFALVDDQTRLSSHMSQSSWRMGGGKMKIETDAFGGKRVGSKIRLSGNVMGVALWLKEVVTDREPPYRKAWDTIGQPRLLVIGPY